MTGVATMMLTLVLVGVMQVLLTPFRRRGYDRRLGGRGQLRLFRRALRSGEVPGNADVPAWRASVRRSLSPELRRRARLVWVAAAVLLVLAVGIGGGTVALGAESVADFTGTSIFLVLLFVVCGLWAVVSTRRRYRRLERLQVALDA